MLELEGIKTASVLAPIPLKPLFKRVFVEAKTYISMS